ncbi:hypothetical protein Tco_1184146 [Tanacetum coccineum]
MLMTPLKLPSSTGIESMLNGWLRKFKVQPRILKLVPIIFPLANSIVYLRSEAIGTMSLRSPLGVLLVREPHNLHDSNSLKGIPVSNLPLRPLSCYRNGCPTISTHMANSFVVIALHSAWPRVAQLTLVVEGKVLEALGRSWKPLETLDPSIHGRASQFKAMVNKTEKNGASGSAVVGENRGRDDARQHPKKRGTSKDVVASLDKRVAGVETSLVELKTKLRAWKITKIRTKFGEEVSKLHHTTEDLQADVALCKWSLASGGGNTSNHGLKFDVPKP